MLLLGDVVHSTVELIGPGWQFAFDEDVAAAADFLDPWFGRLATAEASRQWIFM